MNIIGEWLVELEILEKKKFLRYGLYKCLHLDVQEQSDMFQKLHNKAWYYPLEFIA